MQKTELRKKFKNYYSATSAPAIYSFPESRHLALTGRGVAGDELFRSQTEALYNVAYAIKKKLKLAGADFAVPPLEGSWWKDDGGLSPYEGGLLNWQLMIRMPETITTVITEEARAEVIKKKNNQLATGLLLVTVPAGKFAQVLHTGPYSEENSSVEALFSFIKESGYVIHGRHHEVYLSDPRKTVGTKLKTIIRYPVV